MGMLSCFVKNIGAIMAELIEAANEEPYQSSNATIKGLIGYMYNLVSITI